VAGAAWTEVVKRMVRVKRAVVGVKSMEAEIEGSRSGRV
jgi:hypothetical protein